MVDSELLPADAPKAGIAANAGKDVVPGRPSTSLRIAHGEVVFGERARTPRKEQVTGKIARQAKGVASMFPAVSLPKVT